MSIPPTHLAFLACSVIAAHAAAQDKSGYTLVSPTPAALMREMSTDRPDTTESPFTVDAGHVQVELSFFEATIDRRGDENGSSRTWSVAPMLLKIGLLNNADLQLGVEPFLRQRSTDDSTGTRESVSGMGDLTTRLKINLWGNDQFKEPGDFAVGIMPFVTLPTGARALGSGRVTGGLILPVALRLPAEISMGAMLELDIDRNTANDRYVTDLVHSVTLGRPLLPRLEAYLEYAGFANMNHDQRYRSFLDAGLTYELSENLVLDAGVRLGLTRASDDVGCFMGMSWRH